MAHDLPMGAKLRCMAVKVFGFYIDEATTMTNPGNAKRQGDRRQTGIIPEQIEIKLQRQ
jgi:hypothetical protein